MVAYPSSIPPPLAGPPLVHPSPLPQERQEELERAPGVDWTRAGVDGEVEIEKTREAATDYTNEK